MFENDVLNNILKPMLTHHGDFFMGVLTRRDYFFANISHLAQYASWEKKFLAKVVPR